MTPTIKPNFQTLFETVTRIEAGIDTINERCAIHGEKLNGHDRTLYGDDGRHGVVGTQADNVARVSSLEQSLSDIKEEIKTASKEEAENDKTWKKFAISLVTEVIKVAAVIMAILAAEHWSSIGKMFGK
jgi:hypothetical protein